VDDGSNDDTESLIQKWKDEGIIPITYYKQENKGKMQAHNKGVEMCDTKLFVCVDSDDYLVDNAVEDIIEVWNTHNRTDIAGIVGKRGTDKYTMLGTGEFPNCESIALTGLKKRGFVGDTTLCFDIDVIKKYPFPVIENEKFISEDYIYDQISYDGFKFIVHPYILTVCNYLDDGYTKNMDKISYLNPVGRMYQEAQKMKFATSFNKKFKASARYNQYKIISHHKDIRKFKIFEKIMLYVTFPIGYLGAYKKRKRVGY
jgi:glycosyltransferase involved in cell wall biosynthesis